MAEIALEGKIYHSFITHLLFTTTITRNMIKVFGFSEEFTPKQHILQYFKQSHIAIHRTHRLAPYKNE